MLKPLSSAIAIGTGGPFGAEGPIIMTGGAFGSLIAQVFHLTGVGAKDAARRGRGRGHDGDVRDADRRRAARGRAAALRVEAAQPHPGRARGATSRSLRRVRCSAPGRSFPCRRTRHRRGRTLSRESSRASSPAVSRAIATVAVYASEDAIRQAADPLDVVAGDRRSRGRHRRLVEPRALGVGYDIDRCAAARATRRLGGRRASCA